jgi:hypothetical protein
MSTGSIQLIAGIGDEARNDGPAAVAELDLLRDEFKKASSDIASDCERKRSYARGGPYTRR